MKIYGYDDAHSKYDLVNVFSNPNIIINGDLQVWQRGEEHQVSNGVKYGPDRIRFWENGANIGVRHVATDVGKGLGLTWFGKVGSLAYYMESNDLLKYKGKKITISYSINKEVKIYQTIVCNSAKLFDHNFEMKVGDVLNYIKAEIGEVATINIPKLYSNDLEECKRYYQIYDAGELRIQQYANDGTNKFWCFNYLKPMRIPPTITGTWNIYDANTTLLRSGANIIPSKVLYYNILFGYAIQSASGDTYVTPTSTLILDSEIYDIL